jgi:hypothetical protein
MWKVAMSFLAATAKVVLSSLKNALSNVDLLTHLIPWCVPTIP